MRRGEIWWGRPALPGGSRKRRPFLVISHDAFNQNDRYPKTMVVYLTAVRSAGAGYPWEVELPRGAGGLPVPSVAKCGELYTFFKADLDERLGALRADQMTRVDAALSLALGLTVRA